MELWERIPTFLARDVAFCVNERRTRDTDDAFIRSAADGRRETTAGLLGDVDADNGEITVFEFEDVGASGRAAGKFSVGVRVGSESSYDGHGLFRVVRGFNWSQKPAAQGMNMSASPHGEDVVAGVEEHRGERMSPRYTALILEARRSCWENASVTKSVHSALSSIFCDHVRSLRERAGMTQRDLAAALGREHGMVARIELGERRVDVLEVYQLFKALGADPKRELWELMKEFEAVEHSSKG